MKGDPEKGGKTKRQSDANTWKETNSGMLRDRVYPRDREGRGRKTHPRGREKEPGSAHVDNQQWPPRTWEVPLAIKTLLPWKKLTLSFQDISVGVWGGGVSPQLREGALPSDTPCHGIGSRGW